MYIYILKTAVEGDYNLVEERYFLDHDLAVKYQTEEIESEWNRLVPIGEEPTVEIVESEEDLIDWVEIRDIQSGLERFSAWIVERRIKKE